MKEKEFDKLKQIDRIEYMLLKQKIGSYKFYTPTVIWAIIELYFFMIIIFLLMYLAYGVSDQMLILNEFIKTAKWLYVITLIIDLLAFAYYRKQIKDLNRHFGGVK